MTSDTMINGDSTEFGACSLPLSIVLMYLNPNPNPNLNQNREGWGTDTSDDRYNDKRGFYGIRRLFAAVEYRADVFEP